MLTMNKLTIIKQKGLISVQDLGRFHAQHLGFSASGVADEFAFLSGNKWLGNALNAAALEVTFGQITLTVDSPCQIIITGADCQAKVNNVRVQHWQIINLSANDHVELLAPKSGVYSYICISGGIQTPLYFDSASELPKALKVNKPNKEATQYLFTCEQHITAKPVPSTAIASAINYYFQQDKKSVHVLRFIPHHLWHELTTKAQQKISRQVFQLQASSNKMGYRLKSSNPIDLASSQQLSKPVTLGAIQLPSDGQPIILMKDRQTIGGYPTLGCVIQVDIPRLAQLNAHQNVKLLPITIEKAQAQLQAFYQK